MLKDKLQKSKPFIGYGTALLGITGYMREWYVQKIDKRFEEQDKKMEQFRAEMKTEIKELR